MTRRRHRAFAGVAQALHESQLPQAPPLASLASTRRAVTAESPDPAAQCAAAAATRFRQAAGISFNVA